MFRLVWIEQALNELADLWTRADHILRQAITRACHSIEQKLTRQPHAQGESRSAGKRIMFEPPLAVNYRIEKDGRTVTILHVRLMRQRSS